jgi:hypothetical protein
MKCWHLVAALAFAGCGLNTSSLPSTGRSGEDAGVSATDASSPVAGSPASWPARRRPSRLEKDGGSSDTKDASKPGAGGPTTGDKDAQTDPAQGGPANPSGNPNPSGQPTSGSPSKPGSQAQPPGSSSGDGSDDDDNGNGQNGSAPDAGAPDAGSSGSQDPDDDGSSDEDEHADENDHGDGDDGDDGDNSGQPGSGSNGHGSQQPHSDDAVSIIVDLVIAILDLSLGPVRPAEIEALVSSILVLSLAPAELAAESLVAVLDALDDTQICLDHPERCNPLCTNLESDCSACGRDEDCIERIEEMCKVKLPKSCF